MQGLKKKIEQITGSWFKKNQPVIPKDRFISKQRRTYSYKKYKSGIKKQNMQNIYSLKSLKNSTNKDSKNKSQPENSSISIIIVGNQKVGKSTLVNSVKSHAYKVKQMKHEQVNITNLTIKTNQNSKNYQKQLEIYDFSCQNNFIYNSQIAEYIKNNLYNKCKIVLICFSLIDKISQESAHRHWYTFILSLLRQVQIIFVGTKLDLYKKTKYKNMKTKNIVQLRKLYKHMNMKFRACSAKTIKNLEQLLIEDQIQNAQDNKEKQNGL